VKTTISGAIHDDLKDLSGRQEKVLTRGSYPTIVHRTF
jgi:hypothetical protein